MDAFARQGYLSLLLVSGVLLTSCQPGTLGDVTGTSSAPPVAAQPAPGPTATDTPEPTPAPTKTPAPVQGPIASFSNCLNRLGGRWAYGIVPYACDSSFYGSDSYVRSLYGQLLVNEPSYNSGEEVRYVTEAFATIRDSAAYYLRTRETNPSAEEIAAWQLAVYAMVERESLWSHFRNGMDGHLKITRGDSGHGFGLMQIDDRAHTVSVQSGKAWDLMGNVVLGLDIFYTGWRKAASASCVSSPTQWEERARAAYSYYNSGSKLCRWTDPNDPWAQNDEGFLQSYTQTPWIKYVSDASLASSVNVECAIESPNTEKTECVGK